MKMKDLIKLMTLAIICLVSCEKPSADETGNALSPDEPPVTFAEVAFEGTFADETMLWNEGDAVKVVYSHDGSSVGEARVDAESAGGSDWSFSLENAGVGTYVRVIYPATAEYPLTMTLPSEQTTSNDLRTYSFFLSNKVVTSSESPVKFSLNCANAIVQLNFISEQYSEYMLKKVDFSAGSKKISGDWRVEEDGVINIAKSGSQDHVIVTLAQPIALSQTPSVSFTAFPVDLTGEDVIVSVTLADGDGKEMSLPLALEAGQLLAGKVNEFDVEVSDAGVVDWFVMDDPRDMLGYYAYGPANTIMVAKTVGAAGTVPCVIDVKPRGDFSKVRKPVYYGILTKAEMNRKLLSVDGSNAYVPKPTSKVSDNFTITVDVENGDYYSSTGTWGTVGIYDKDYNLLWSYMIYTYFSDDTPVDVDCGTHGKIMDRALGQAFSARWLGVPVNQEAMGSDKYYTSAAYFQWGRKDPFMRTKLSGTPYAVLTEQISVEESISYPFKMVVLENKNWAETANDNLWGAVSGKKTVFDPCPQGYKVPGTPLMRAIDNGTSREIDESGENIKYWYVKNPSTDDDKWIYSGLLWNSSVSSDWGNASTEKDGLQVGYNYWINTQATVDKANAIHYSWNGKMTGTSTGKNASKARGGAVRCVKEEVPVEEIPAE